MDEFRTWAEFAGFFRQQELLLGGHELVLDWQRAFARVSEDGQPSTDKVVRSYIARREWPFLEDTDRFELLLRLRCAQWYCLDFHQQDPAGEYLQPEGFEEQVAGLLIEYWRDVGRIDWLSSLLD